MSRNPVLRDRLGRPIPGRSPREVEAALDGVPWPSGSLVLFCKGEPYTLAVVPVAANVEARVQFHVSKAGGPGYLVTIDCAGIAHCECGDHHWRHEGSDQGGCKHVTAVRDSGLIHLSWNPNKTRT